MNSSIQEYINQNSSIINQEKSVIDEYLKNIGSEYRFDFKTTCELDDVEITYLSFSCPDSQLILRRSPGENFVVGTLGELHDEAIEKMLAEQMTKYDTYDEACKELQNSYIAIRPSSKVDISESNAECLFCKSKSTMWVEANSILECKNCGLIYRIDAHAREEEYGEVYGAQDGHYFSSVGKIQDKGLSHGYEFYEEWIDVILGPSFVRSRIDLFESYIKANSKVLEVGCACGIFLSEFKRRGNETKGLELSPPLAKRAFDKYGLNVNVGTIQSLNVGEQFDAIIYMDVFEHIADVQGELSAIKQRLSPDGRLLLELPSQGSLESQIVGKDFLFGEHLLFYTPKGIQSLLEQNGFAVEGIQTLPDRYFSIDRFLTQGCIDQMKKDKQFERMIVVAKAMTNQ